MAQQTVGELRFEPGRLRRHQPIRVRYRHQLLHAGRVHREGDRSSAAVDATFEFDKPSHAADEVDARVSARIADREAASG